MEGYYSRNLTMGLLLVVVILMMITCSSATPTANNSPCIAKITNECNQSYNISDYLNVSDPSQLPCCSAWAQQIKNDRPCICSTVYPTLMKQAPKLLESLLSSCNIGVTSDSLCSGKNKSGGNKIASVGLLASAFLTVAVLFSLVGK